MGMWYPRERKIKWYGKSYMKRLVTKFLGKKQREHVCEGVRPRRRLSVSQEEDAVLPLSGPGDSFALTQAGVEFSRIKVNQDAYFVNADRMIFAVFDGHGRQGHHCSKFVKDQLSQELADREVTMEELCNAMVKTGDMLKAETNIDSDFSGTTVLVVMVTSEAIISAWLGDSRAVMGTMSLSERALGVVALSKDHKPDLPLERKRILKAGGVIKQLRDENGKKCGPLRVFKPSSTVPGVNFSRSLGDEAIHKYGVSSEVECFVQPRTPRDRFIVIASDGIFEFLDNLEVAEIVYHSQSVEQACRDLIRRARDLWIASEDAADDTTIICLKLN